MPKVTKIVPPISEWGVHNYGLKLEINPIRVDFNGLWSLDVEDNEQDVFVGLGVSNGKEVYYWSDFTLIPANLPIFIAHNGRTDVEKLIKWGFPIDHRHLVWDTQLIGHILDSSLGKAGYGLKAMAKAQLNIEYPAYEDIVGKKKAKERLTLDKHPLELVANYNAMDCYATYKLYERQKQCLIL